MKCYYTKWRRNDGKRTRLEIWRTPTMYVIPTLSVKSLRYETETRVCHEIEVCVHVLFWSIEYLNEKR